MLLKLWTVRPLSDYEILCQNGIFRTDETFIDDYHVDAYRWIAEQLAKKTPKPTNVTMPVWAWFRYEGTKKPKPDLRKTAHLPPKTQGVRIEFDIPENQVLLSDFDAWHCVLNDFCYALTDDEYDYYEKLEQTLSKTEFLAIKQQTWQRIFDLDLIPNPDEYAIQAVFWELKLEWVKKVDFFTAR